MPRIAAGDIQIDYESYGQGEPLLLIMGFGLPGVAWLPVLPFLSGFHCIYYDNRGTGNSDKPDRPQLGEAFMNMQANPTASMKWPMTPATS